LKDVDIDLNKLIFYLDRKALFSGQWQIKKGKNQSVDEYNNYLGSYAKPLLDKWLDIINKYGGEIPQTYGVPVEEIQEGIRNGVRKVNIDTDNRLAFTAAVREAAFADKANFDPRHFNKPARKYMKQVCLDRYKQFWCEGQASKIKQNSTNYFADLYAKGDLDPKVKTTV